MRSCVIKNLSRNFQASAKLLSKRNLGNTQFQHVVSRGLITTSIHNNYSSDFGFNKALLASLVVLGGIIASTPNSECEEEKEKKPEEDPFAGTAFFPPIEPFHRGYLKVSDIHTIAYSEYGNPEGKPALFIHGGPGGGTIPAMARFFDPKVYHVILVDQRGCGESTPFANLTDNTTDHLIEDFEKLRKRLGITQWQLFGGSWGSTLSLAYAIKHPEVVTELVLRGIFLCRKLELDWMYEGKGANYIFPEDFEMYQSVIPENERNNFMEAYHRRLTGELGKEEMIRAAKAWSLWEGRIVKLQQSSIESLQSSFGDENFATAFARIENHFFYNEKFLVEGYLLEKENIAKIAHIPTVIVQGRYDIVCPPISAYELHKALPSSELHYTLAGHTGFEKANIEELVKATEKFKKDKNHHNNNDKNGNNGKSNGSVESKQK